MILVDSADHASIAAALAHPVVSGATTNPSLVVPASDEAVSLDEYLRRVDALCALPRTINATRFKHLMVQVAGPSDGWRAQIAQFTRTVGDWSNGTLWIKLPATVAGLAACEDVRAVGAQSLITAVFTPAQALSAMEAGADGIAVYYRRLQDATPDWSHRLEQIAGIVTGRDKLLLLASISTVELLQAALRYGQDVTIAPGVLNRVLDDDATRAALDAFDRRIAFDKS